MDTAAARILADLNTAFYGRVGESFSQTRSCPWDGWRGIARIVSEEAESRTEGLFRVADIACGNMRFAAFLLENSPGLAFAYVGLDNCPSMSDGPSARLRAKGLDVRFEYCDILNALLSEEEFGLPGLSESDLAVSFGFMHHIPSAELRARFLRNVLGQMKPGSILALSFWRFLDDPKLGSKAARSTETALSSHPELRCLELESGDCFLGWQDDCCAIRYCHSFDDAELEALVSAVSEQALMTDCFAADGKNGKSNQYLVFRKNHTEILH